MNTRNDMIEFLTDNELRYLIDNNDKHTFTEMVEFFANGGFTTWTDEELLKKTDAIASED